MVKDMVAAVKFDRDMVTTDYTIQFTWGEQAREFATLCAEHGHSTSQLVGLVDSFLKLDPRCIFRIGREKSRVLYALTDADLNEDTLIEMFREHGCDEVDEYNSNWHGRRLYRFWWD